MPGAEAIVVVEVAAWGVPVAPVPWPGLLVVGGATVGAPEARAAAPSWTVGTWTVVPTSSCAVSGRPL